MAANASKSLNAGGKAAPLESRRTAGSMLDLGASSGDLNRTSSMARSSALNLDKELLEAEQRKAARIARQERVSHTLVRSSGEYY